MTIETPHVQAMLAESKRLAALCDGRDGAELVAGETLDGKAIPVGALLERSENLARHARAEIEDERLRDFWQLPRI